MICLKSELSGIDIFIVLHDDPASENTFSGCLNTKYILKVLKMDGFQSGYYLVLLPYSE